MLQVIQYVCLNGNDSSELTKLVQNLLDEGGWQPLGSVAVAQETDDCYPLFAQVMVRYAEASK
jgi:hypothetical protein